MTSSRTPPRLLSDRELSALLDAAQAPRDRALISILIGTGLRLAEIPRLEIDCVVRRLDGSALIYVPSGRNHTGRLVPIGGAVREVLDAYLADRQARHDASGPLFEGNRGDALSAAAASAIVMRAMVRAEIDPEVFVCQEGGGMRLLDVFTLNYAERHLRVGGDLALLGQQLGHRSVSATRNLVAQLASIRSNPRDECRITNPSNGRERPRSSQGRETRPIQLPNGSGTTVARFAPSTSRT